VDICKGDSIDLSSLEKNFRRAADSETRYWQQNDAKFRALAQKVPTYEDFKEIVAASHLRPLDAKERIDFLNPEQQRHQQQQRPLDKRQTAPWNQCAGGGGVVQNGLSEMSARNSTFDFNSVKIPVNDFELQKQWRTLKTTWQKSILPSPPPADTCSSSAPTCSSSSSDMHQLLVQYLLHIGVDNLRQIWSVEVGNFGEIIETLSAVMTSSSASSSSAPASVSSSTSSTSNFDKEQSGLENASPTSKNSEENSKASEIASPADEALRLSVASIADVIQSSRRFELSTQFLSASEKEALSGLITAVKEKRAANGLGC